MLEAEAWNVRPARSGGGWDVDVEVRIHGVVVCGQVTLVPHEITRVPVAGGSAVEDWLSGELLDGVPARREYLDAIEGVASRVIQRSGVKPAEVKG